MNCFNIERINNIEHYYLSTYIKLRIWYTSHIPMYINVVILFCIFFSISKLYILFKPSDLT